MASIEPYDPETQRVTLAANFSVPAVPTGGSCISQVSTGVNDALQGGGHSIELVMEGEIPPTREVGDFPTTTALTVAPASSRPGHTVTLTAQVARGTAANPPAADPTGTVEFRDNGVLIGQQAIDSSGKAAFTTTGLAVGEHDFTAKYLGDADYFVSTSPTVTHLVAAAPTVTVDMASTVLIGGLPRPAIITVANPAELSAPIENSRLDFVIQRVVSPGVVLTPNRVAVEWLNGSTWEPVTITAAGSNAVAGSIAPLGGFSVAPGETELIRLRIAAPTVAGTPSPTVCGGAQPTCPGPVELRATLNQLDGGGAVVEALASTIHSFTLVESTRRDTTLAFLQSPRPHTVRQGYAIEFITRVAPAIPVAPTGTAEVFVDGRRVDVRAVNTPYADGYLEELPVASSAIQGLFLLPPDFELGTHIVSVRYNGDAFYRPSEITSTFTVLEAAGHPFVCRAPAGIGSARHEWGANIVFDADVPVTTAVAGETVELDVSSAQILMNRSFTSDPMPSFNNNATTPIGPALKGITFGLGPNGQGAATALERQGNTAQASTPNPAPPDQVDQTITFHGATAAVTIEGEPGDIVPVVLDEIAIDFALLGSIPAPSAVTCVPVGEPMVLGEVEIAGTTVTASPDVAREVTDEVTVKAQTFPAAAAGSVSFSSDVDGALGSVGVVDGTASLDTTALSPGTHVLTAAFDATDPSVPDTEGTTTVRVTYSPRSVTEAFVVAARTDYTGVADEDDVVADAAALDGGKTRTVYLGELSRTDEYLTHVVNEMYLDTLGREGDPDGVAFWVGRLRDGWTVARVAANFYSSDEYYQRVGGTDEAWVRDLYDVLLGRDADEPGLAYWIGEIPRRGRGGVALAFFQTPESARARVVALYQQFLGRNPNTADRNFWANRVIARGDLILAVELTLSAEYNNRAANRFPLV